MKLVVDTIEFATLHVPSWHSVSISGYHIREAGSTATQELAFTLRDGMEYVEACVARGARGGADGAGRGLDIDAFAPRLSFFFNSHNEFFEEVCKLRAARRIWARMMKERYGAKNPRSWYMKTHVQTAGCSLTEQQPYNNIVRVAYQAMAGVLGGCQSLHTDSMDETLGLPTEQAVKIALRTQQILAHETGVTRVTDPLGGSWFVEALTDTMEREALNFIHEIDMMGEYGDWKSPKGQIAKGQVADQKLEEHPAYQARRTYGMGAVNGIHKGYFRRAIAEASYRFSEEMEAGDRVIVGLNEYVEADEKRQVDILEIPHQVEVDQCDRLAAFKKKRDAGAVKRALDGIRAAAQKDENTMPALIEGAEHNCTLGEMVQALADIYGRYGGGPEW